MLSPCWFIASRWGVGSAKACHPERFGYLIIYSARGILRALNGPAAGPLSHCAHLSAIVCAKGFTIAGMMWLSTRSWQVLRWFWYDSAKALVPCRPQYCRTVK